MSAHIQSAWNHQHQQQQHQSGINNDNVSVIGSVLTSNSQWDPSTQARGWRRSGSRVREVRTHRLQGPEHLDRAHLPGSPANNFGHNLIVLWLKTKRIIKSGF